MNQAWALETMGGYEVMMPTDNAVEDDTEYSADSVKLVHHLILLYFRCKLIEHFDVLFKRNALVWPTQWWATIKVITFPCNT